MKIKELEREIKTKKEKVISVETMIDIKRSDLYILESQRDELAYDVESMEKELKNLKLIEFMNKNDKPTGDDFKDSFVLASRFTSRSFELTRSIDYVMLEKDELLAIDGYKLIKIKCNIPKELQEGYIPWNVRKDLKKHFIKKEDYGFKPLNARELLSKHEKSGTCVDINMKEFYERYCIIRKYHSGDNYLSTFDIEGLKMAFNNKFLKSAKEIFKDETFTLIYPQTSIQPIIMKSEKYTMLILPVKLFD